MRTGCRLLLLVAALGGGCKDKASPHPQRQGHAVDAAVARLVTDAPVDGGAHAEPPRSEHTAWKLVDNRAMAHRGIGGELVIDARTAAFARYTHFGVPVAHWQLGVEVAGERVAVADRSGAVIDVPIIPEQLEPTQITVRVHAAEPGQVLAVSVNSKAASKRAKVPLDPGWQTVAFAVEPALLPPGENQIGFETINKAKGKKVGKTKLAFSWIRVGATHPEGDVDPLAAATFDPKTDSIELAEGASLTWYVAIPEGAHLVAEVGGAECRVDVGARAGDGKLVGGLLAADQDRVDLSGMGGRVVRLSLTARDCPRARITHPRVTLHGPRPEPLAKAERPKFVVLWVMDALRADKIPLFTPGARAQAPGFDELAKSSAVFRQYYVQGNESQTSHSSIWTSLYPAVHGVRLAGQGGTSKIASSFEIIGELLTKAGLYTMGVTANGFVTPDGGYARGFKEFRNMMREGGPLIIYGEKVVDAALEKLDKHRDVPAFLFIGSIDNHYPWIARKPWIDTYSPNYKGPFKQFASPTDLGFRPNEMGCHITPPAEEIERLRAIYDSDVSYADQQLGRFVEQLKTWGIWDQTLLIVTSDHGDELFEDERCGHGGSLRDSLVRVPLLIHDPSRVPGGTIVDEGTDGVDLLPTILDALDQPAFDAAQGESLIPLAQGVGRGWPRPSYTSMYEYAHTMRIDRWKIRIGATGGVIIEDRVADPAEHENYATVRPIERRMLTDNLGLFLALRTQWKKSAWGVVTNISADGAEAIDEALTP